MSVTRKSITFSPDSSRVVARYFEAWSRPDTENDQPADDFEREASCLRAGAHALREFASRHRNILRIFFKHCARNQHLIEGNEHRLR